MAHEDGEGTEVKPEKINQPLWLQAIEIVGVGGTGVAAVYDLLMALHMLGIDAEIIP